MKMTFQLTGTLTVIATIAGLSIGVVYDKTKDVIIKQKEQSFKTSLESLFPAGVSISSDSLSRSDETIPFWIAQKKTAKGNETIGFAFKASGQGYSGAVNSLVAVSGEGKILGMTIISQTETPGLGTRVSETVSKSTFWTGLFAPAQKIEPWFQAMFRDLSIVTPISISKQGEWHTLSVDQKKAMIAKNEVTAITGATITTRTVTNSMLEQANTVKEINDYLASKTGGVQ